MDWQIFIDRKGDRCPGESISSTIMAQQYVDTSWHRQRASHHLYKVSDWFP